MNEDGNGYKDGDIEEENDSVANFRGCSENGFSIMLHTSYLKGPSRT